MTIAADDKFHRSASSSAAAFSKRSTRLVVTVTTALLATWVLGFLSGRMTTPPLATTSGVRQGASSSTSSEEEKAVAAEEDGWKPIHIFYGTREHLKGVSSFRAQGPSSPVAAEAPKFFSQVGQDEIVSRLFRGKQGGFFVDLAANDAVELSNTYALETLYKWDGICIEPNARYWPSLSYRTCHVVGAVAGSDREEVDFFFGSGETGVYGGIVGEQYDNKDPSKQPGWRQPRLTVTLDEVLRRFGAPKEVDYLSLDVEGAEGLILTQSVLSQYTFKVVSLERPKASLQELLAANDYTKLRDLSHWGETLWAHKSARHELDLSALQA